MKLRTFSVVGEALNFGGRRMETIMRVAWLPIVLSMVLAMASVFAILSFANGRLITFTDLIGNISYNQAVAMSAKSVSAATAEVLQPVFAIFTPGVEPSEISRPGWSIVATYLGTLILSGVLISSFMAPLIRFAGLGERPQPGWLHLPFGGDQLRYLAAGVLSLLLYGLLAYLPILAASYWGSTSIAQAVNQTYASFPNPDSLHTIELVKGDAVLKERGETWIYTHGVPMLAVAPFAFLLWFALIQHFNPSARLASGGMPRVNLRMLLTTAVVFVAVLAAFHLGFKNAKISGVEKYTAGAIGALFLVALAQRFLSGNIGPANLPARAIVVLFWMLAAFGALWYFALGASGVSITDPQTIRLAVIAVSLAFSYYLMLRLTPYQGVAVSRRSLAPAGTLTVSRGWNLVRLLGVILLVYLIIVIVSAGVNTVAIGYGGAVVNVLYQATLSATKLVNSGEPAEWVYPFFVWAWTGFVILVNLLLTFFFYGVIAGLQGRLYRDSEVEAAGVAG